MSFGRWKIELQAWFRHLSAGRLAAVAVAACIASSMSGCGGFQMAENSWKYNSSWNNFVMKHRNQGWATKAWHRRKHGFCNQPCLNEFCDGFTAGYLSVADGGDGCTPPFAPREYWGWEYQSPEGQQKVAAWFSGFPHGCRAAEEDGIGSWTQIQTSYQIQKEYDQAGLLGEGQRPGMYPMPEAIPAGEIAAKNFTNASTPATGVLTTPQPEVLDAVPANIDNNSGPILNGIAPGANVEIPQDHSSGIPGNSRLLR